MDAVPTSPTTAEVQLNPPATGGPVDSYKVTLCPQPSGTCVTATCPTADCEVPGLTPGTTYDVTAEAIVGGKPVPVSNSAEVTTPVLGAPALTSAVDTSSTTGHATAEPPPGVTFTQVWGMGRVVGVSLCSLECLLFVSGSCAQAAVVADGVGDCARRLAHT